jgi:hypothetical protein
MFALIGGRGMYGRECVGIECKSSIFAMAIAICHSILEETQGTVGSECLDNAYKTLSSLKRLSISQDSLGLGSIIYFPDVKWPEGRE